MTINFKGHRHTIIEDTGLHAAPFGHVRVVLSRGIVMVQSAEDPDGTEKVIGNWGVTVYQHKTGETQPIERPTEYFDEVKAREAYGKFTAQLPK